MRTAVSIPILVLPLLAACSFHARDADSYREVTRELLETRASEIRGCYEKRLEEDRRATGTVVVRFTVKAESGMIVDAIVDAEASTAPAPLGECVVEALEGLMLDPPDARDGDATFTWRFETS